MTYGTIGQLLCIHIVLFHQRASEGKLIIWRDIIEVIDFRHGSDEFLGCTMTIQTPLHLQRVRSPYQRHHVHIAMTCLTRHAFLHMNAMIEVDKIREVMNANPLKRHSRRKTCSHRLEHRAGVPDLRVAGHTGISGWNAGEG